MHGLLHGHMPLQPAPDLPPPQPGPTRHPASAAANPGPADGYGPDGWDSPQQGDSAPLAPPPPPPPPVATGGRSPSFLGSGPPASSLADGEAREGPRQGLFARLLCCLSCGRLAPAVRSGGPSPLGPSSPHSLPPGRRSNQSSAGRSFVPSTPGPISLGHSADSHLGPLPVRHLDRIQAGDTPPTPADPNTSPYGSAAPLLRLHTGGDSADAATVLSSSGSGMAPLIAHLNAAATAAPAAAAAAGGGVGGGMGGGGGGGVGGGMGGGGGGGGGGAGSTGGGGFPAMAGTSTGPQAGASRASSLVSCTSGMTSSSRPSRWGVLAGFFSAGLRSFSQLATLAEPGTGNLRKDAVQDLTRRAGRLDVTRTVGQVTDMSLVGQGSAGLVYRGRAADGSRVAVKYISSRGPDGMAAPATEGLLSRALCHPNLVQTSAWHVTRVTPESFLELHEAVAALATRAAAKRARRGGGEASKRGRRPQPRAQAGSVAAAGGGGGAVSGGGGVSGGGCVSADTVGAGSGGRAGASGDGGAVAAPAETPQANGSTGDGVRSRDESTLLGGSAFSASHGGAGGGDGSGGGGGGFALAILDLLRASAAAVGINRARPASLHFHRSSHDVQRSFDAAPGEVGPLTQADVPSALRAACGSGSRSLAAPAQRPPQLQQLPRSVPELGSSLLSHTRFSDRTEFEGSWSVRHGEGLLSEAGRRSSSMQHAAARGAAAAAPTAVAFSVNMAAVAGAAAAGRSVGGITLLSRESYGTQWFGPSPNPSNHHPTSAGAGGQQQGARGPGGDSAAQPHALSYGGAPAAGQAGPAAGQAAVPTKLAGSAAVRAAAAPLLTRAGSRLQIASTANIPPPPAPDGSGARGDAGREAGPSAAVESRQLLEGMLVSADPDCSRGGGHTPAAPALPSSPAAAPGSVGSTSSGALSGTTARRLPSAMLLRSPASFTRGQAHAAGHGGSPGRPASLLLMAIAAHASSHRGGGGGAGGGGGGGGGHAGGGGAVSGSSPRANVYEIQPGSQATSTYSRTISAVLTRTTTSSKRISSTATMPSGVQPGMPPPTAHGSSTGTGRATGGSSSQTPSGWGSAAGRPAVGGGRGGGAGASRSGGGGQGDSAPLAEGPKEGGESVVGAPSSSGAGHATGGSGGDGGGGGAAPAAAGAQEATEQSWRTLQQILQRLAARPGDYLTRITMEDADQGSLLGAVRSGRFIDAQSGGPHLPMTLLTALDVARGMAYLHSHNVIHGDLKPSNVLLVSEPLDPRGFVAKVSDFGLSRIITRGQDFLQNQEPHGTVRYLAPEAVTGSSFKASDLYSFAVVLWQLITGEWAPWPGLRNVQVLMGVMQGDLRLCTPPTTHPPLADLVATCSAYDHTTRPTFVQVAAQLEAMLRDLPQPQPTPAPAPALPIGVAGSRPTLYNSRAPAGPTPPSWQTVAGPLVYRSASGLDPDTRHLSTSVSRLPVSCATAFNGSTRSSYTPGSTAAGHAGSSVAASALASSASAANGRTASAASDHHHAASGPIASAASGRTASAASGPIAIAASGRTASAASGRTASAASGRTASAASDHAAASGGAARIPDAGAAGGLAGEVGARAAQGGLTEDVGPDDVALLLMSAPSSGASSAAYGPRALLPPAQPGPTAYHMGFGLHTSASSAATALEESSSGLAQTHTMRSSSSWAITSATTGWHTTAVLAQMAAGQAAAAAAGGSLGSSRPLPSGTAAGLAAADRMVVQDLYARRRTSQGSSAATEDPGTHTAGSGSGSSRALGMPASSNTLGRRRSDLGAGASHPGGFGAAFGPYGGGSAHGPGAGGEGVHPALLPLPPVREEAQQGTSSSGVQTAPTTHGSRVSSCGGALPYGSPYAAGGGVGRRSVGAAGAGGTGSGTGAGATGPASGSFGGGVSMLPRMVQAGLIVLGGGARAGGEAGWAQTGASEWARCSEPEGGAEAGAEAEEEPEGDARVKAEAWTAGAEAEAETEGDARVKAVAWSLARHGSSEGSASAEVAASWGEAGSGRLLGRVLRL